jgi:hypothetical protein
MSRETIDQICDVNRPGRTCRPGEATAEWIDRIAVDVLYDARDNGYVMDEAAKMVARIVKTATLAIVIKMAGDDEVQAMIARIAVDDLYDLR